MAERASEPGRVGDEASIEGVIERVRYASDDGEFQVLVVRPESGPRRTIVARGALLEAGERLRARGTLKRHRSGEVQLDAAHVERVLPATREGMEAYLGSGLVPGIGARLAADIVARFGERTLEILDQTPERLREVSGIGPQRAARIADAWRAQKDVRAVMIFLQGHGISPRFAARIHHRFGSGAIAVVEKDPYRLAREVRGIGFLSADRIARSAGIGIDDPRRLRAGLEFALHEAQGEGHVFLPQQILLDSAAGLLGVHADVLLAPLEQLVDTGALVRDDARGEAAAVYRRDAFQMETECARRVGALLHRSSVVPQLSAAGLATLESQLGFALASGQRAALQRLCGPPLGVLTGGPGTGKTTIVRAIVDWASAAGVQVELASPTGRAAQRLAESTGRSARTLHRLLEFDPREMRFRRDEEQPLEAGLVIVDEASMLDLFLLRALLRALSPRTALLLVGDVEQLPSVGAGDVLRDLIESDALAVARLDRVYRQEAGSSILACAHAIRRGEMPEPDSGAHGQFFFIRAEDPELATARVCELVTKRIPEAFGIDGRGGVQVLVPTHRGPLGTRALNDAVQEAMGLQGPSVEAGRVRFHVGDRVLQTRNNYTLEVFNGDIGHVEALDPEMGTMDVAFDGRRIRYTADQFDELELAWAVSVHKSQGSEFPAVVLVLGTQHFVMLQRNLAYTAVTRARQLLCIVGTARALRMAIENVQSNRRWTRLDARVRERATRS